MNQKSIGVNKTVLLLLVIAGFLLGIFLLKHTHVKRTIDPNQFHGAYLQQPKTVNEFSLVGIDHKEFNKDKLQGQWTLVFFGFTNCPSICPTTLAQLSKMYRMLQHKGVKKLPQVVFVSLDPDRDSLQKLEHYVHAFHGSFYAATGKEQNISALAKEMGIAFAKVPLGTDVKNYDVQHGGAVLLFNPQGELNALFTPPHQADLLVKDYLMVVA